MVRVAGDGGRAAAARAGTFAWLVVGGVLLYVAIDVALVPLRPQFSVLHSAESDYGSRGSWAWLMDLNFLLRCALSLAAVRAIALAAGRSRGLRGALTLLVVWALASGLLAFFPDDPAGTRLTRSGEIHLVVALVAFLAVVAGTIVGSRALRREPLWRPLAVPLAVISTAALLLFLVLGAVGFGAHSLGGLDEKLFLGLELLWLVVACFPIALGPPRARATS